MLLQPSVSPLLRSMVFAIEVGCSATVQNSHVDLY